MTQPRFNFRGVAASDAPFRGCSAEIGAATTVDEALKSIGWDWTVVKYATEMVAKVPGNANRPSRFSSLVRSDTGYELDHCTSAYTPIQNRDLLTTFMVAAGAADLKLTRAVTLHGGTRLFLIAQVPCSFTLQSNMDLGNGIQGQSAHLTRGEASRHALDETVLEIVLSTGHAPGFRASIKARVLRVLCHNGMSLMADLGSASVCHRGGNAYLRVELMAEAIARATSAFRDYQRQAEVLRATPSHAAMDRAYVVQLLDSVAWDAIVAETQSRVTSARTTPLVGTDLLNAVVDQTYTQRFEAALQVRSTAAVLDAIVSSPGAAQAGNTLWRTVNGVTYQVDHRAGRSIDTAVESSLDGAGDRLKRSALDLALVYAEAAGNPAVRGGKVVN